MRRVSAACEEVGRAAEQPYVPAIKPISFAWTNSFGSNEWTENASVGLVEKAYERRTVDARTRAEVDVELARTKPVKQGSQRLRLAVVIGGEDMKLVDRCRQ